MIRLIVRALYCGFLSLLLAACGNDATPFPVDIPVTPSITAPPSIAPPVRYGLAPNMEGLVAELNRQYDADFDVFTEFPVSEDLGQRYDLLVAYGLIEGWSPVDVVPQIALVINAEADALTPDIARMLTSVVDATVTVSALAIPGSQAVAPVPALSPAEIRSTLANIGRPDGVQIVLGHEFIPGVGELADQLRAVNVATRQDALTNEEIRGAFDSGRIHAALVRLVTPEDDIYWRERFGEDYVIVLYTLPLSYLAIPELTITLATGGFPVARW